MKALHIVQYIDIQYYCRLKKVYTITTTVFRTEVQLVFER